jgi:hypothetical protein
MKRKAIVFVTTAAASGIALSAAGCGGGSYSSQPHSFPVAPTVVAGVGVGNRLDRTGALTPGTQEDRLRRLNEPPSSVMIAS